MRTFFSVVNRDVHDSDSRLSAGAGFPGSNLPVNNPLASGKKGRKASPRRSHADSTLRSGSRCSRLYSFCTLTNRAAPGFLARAASSSCSAEKIRAADLPDLASLDQAVHRAERVGDRHIRIGLMQLIEIDVVGAESAQAVVAGLPDVLRPRPCALVVHRHAELRGDDRPIAAVGECAAEEFLALGCAVDVGGIEEVDACIERGVDDALGGGGVDAHPEVGCSRGRRARRAAIRSNDDPSPTEYAYG
jgi:hypothetical protein